MIRTALAILALAGLLSGCGADGPPKAPPGPPPATENGVAISGQVKVGIAGGS